MKLHILIPFWFCLLKLGYPNNQVIINQLNDDIKGSWKSEQIQIQYIVDSHLVHEQEISAEKSYKYDFDGTMVRVTYPDGTTAQGTYNVVKEAEKKLVVLNLPGTTITYILIAVTPSRLVWQRDLDDVYYNEGQTLKSAERAIYTEVLKK